MNIEIDCSEKELKEQDLKTKEVTTIKFKSEDLGTCFYEDEYLLIKLLRECYVEKSTNT